MKRYNKKLFFIMQIFCIVLIFFLQQKAYPSIIMNDTKINSVEAMTLGGVKQWIYITGDNQKNPILLVIHGGPGFAMLPLFHAHNRELEKKFTVVNWDQRGAGKSYSAKISPNSLSVEQLILDAHELTLKLLTRFDQKKLFILGHSTGSIIGLLLVKRYPQDYYAYVGVGQVINFAENEQMGFNFAWNRAIETKNKLALKELKKIGSPDNKGNYKNSAGYDITTKWVEYFGGEIHNSKNLDALYDEIFSSDIYKNFQNHLLKGYELSEILFDQGIREFDADSEVTSIDIPVYLFSGKYDYDTPIPLVKRYYLNLKAPVKEFIQFENSAHFPFIEESALFNEIMIKKVLPHYCEKNHCE